MHFPFGYFSQESLQTHTDNNSRMPTSIFIEINVKSQWLYQEASDYNSSNTIDSLMK